MALVFVVIRLIVRLQECFERHFFYAPLPLPNEPQHQKTYNLHMQKQRRTADQRLCFRHTDSTTSFLYIHPNFQGSRLLLGLYRSVCHPVGTQNCWFSHDAAQISLNTSLKSQVIADAI